MNLSDLGLKVLFIFRTTDFHVNISEKEIEKFVCDGCHSIKAWCALPQLCWCPEHAPQDGCCQQLALKTRFSKKTSCVVPS